MRLTKRYFGSLCPLALVHKFISRTKSLVVTALTISFLTASAVPISHSANLLAQTTPRSVGLSRPPLAEIAQQRVQESLDKQPLTFEANMGQVKKSVKFSSRGGDYDLFLTASEAILSISGSRRDESKRTLFAHAKQKSDHAVKRHTAVVRMKMVGANPRSRIEGLRPQPGKTNYFIGNNPQRWQKGIPTYGRVKYDRIFPGIDLEFYGNPRQLEYDFTVTPGADPGKVKLRFEGADRVEIDNHGDLVLHTAVGEVRQPRPVIYQHLNGVKKEISGGYVLRGRNTITFSVGQYDKTRPLVIDPAIVYSTYLGGSVRAGADDIAIYTDSVSGNTYAYVIGTTGDQDFPTKNALQQNNIGENSIYVAKLNMSETGPDSLVYSTYLGGNGNQHGYGIAVDSTGAVYLAGYTTSTDFPLANAFRTVSDGNDACITKVIPDGSALVYSSYLGGSGAERAYTIAVDTAGNAYVAGETSSINFPVSNGFRIAGGAGFISKIAPPSGGNPAALVYSSYIDGRTLGIAADSSGNAYAAGVTNSYNLPTTANAFQPTSTAQSSFNSTGFVAKINTLASGPASLVYSTYLGGSDGGNDGGNPFASDGCQAIAVDTAGNAYVTGSTGSADFPTTPNSLKPTFDDDADAFVAKLDTTKSGSASLIYSTYLGGHGGNTGFDQGHDITIDASGNAYVVGVASSPDFPLVNPVQYYSTGLYVTTNEGASSAAINKGMSSYYFRGVAIDTSIQPRTLFIIASHEQIGGPGKDTILKSVDGGNNWTSMDLPPPIGSINCLILDPQSPSTVYVGTDKGIFKSSDSGNAWSAINNGLSYGATTYVNGFTFDASATSQTLYAGTSDNLYKSTDGGNTWVPTGLNSGAATLVINNTTTPHTLFAGFERSTDGGANWTSTNSGFCSSGWTLPTQLLGVDTSTIPATLYANDPDAIQICGTATFLKSTDNGETWQDVYSGDLAIGQLIIDTMTTPSTFYAATGGMSKSTDGGSTWIPIVGLPLGGPFVVDTSSRTSTTPPTIYFSHGGVDRDAFVSVLNPTGSALIFSTFLGGPGPGETATGASGVAVDPPGNIYVVGGTASSIPIVNAFQPDRPVTASLTAFITKLGSSSLPSYSNDSVTTQVAVLSGTLAITFPNITGSTTGIQPTTTVTPMDSTATANFSLSNNLGAYEISTTALTNASLSEPITLAFQVLSINDPVIFSNLQVIHIVNGVPVDATSSRDFATRTIYAAVTSFSPFIIIKGPADQIADLVRLVDSLNLRQGINNSLDAKLQNAVRAYQAATARDGATACNTMSAFMNEVQAQAERNITTVQAQQLLAAARQIRVALGCQ